VSRATLLLWGCATLRSEGLEAIVTCLGAKQTMQNAKEPEQISIRRRPDQRVAHTTDSAVRFGHGNDGGRRLWWRSWCLNQRAADGKLERSGAIT
jgi:hypothetical protein